MKKISPWIIAVYVILVGCKSTQLTKTCEDKEGSVTITTQPIDGPSVISGIVRDLKTNEVLPFAEINLIGRDNERMGVRSDMNGNFIMRGVFMYGDCGLTIRCQGYETIEMGITIGRPSYFQLDIKLKEFVNQTEKPVIYLYPTSTRKITVALDYAGELSHTYPHYPKDGWVVTAESNGVLHDEHGQEYYALFWEGNPSKPLHANDGFVVSGAQTAAFLEEKLAYLGLNRREANEFIMYWLPRMEDHHYNLIHFASDDYEKMARLHIFPTPETIIRVMMLTQPLSGKIDFPLQDLSALKKSRKGFTVVEWGGSVVESIILPD
jgi:hypothetical protein